MIFGFQDGLTALNIAQKLGYISVMEVLKGLSYDGITPDNKNWEEKYKVIAPEMLQETSLMSDSEDEGGKWFCFAYFSSEFFFAISTFFICCKFFIKLFIANF